MEEQIKKEILRYLYLNKDSIYLKPIDNNYKKYYTGVTINYIAYDLLKAKYPRRIVAKCLYELHDVERKIKALYCNDVRRIVFMNNNVDYYNLREGGYNSSKYHKYYDYMQAMIHGKKVNHKKLKIYKNE